MDSFFINKSSSSSSSSSSSLCFLIILLAINLTTTTTIHASDLCRDSCGGIPINYPFGIDDGCGSPYYRHMLVCSDYGKLDLRTPSGRYPVWSISYTDPHILLTDPFMWNCQDGGNFRPTRLFSLDTSTHFSLSSQNDYLFFNCSEENVIIEPKPIFCERFPDRCDSSCDSSSYLCRHLPECGSGLHTSSCCSYYPKVLDMARIINDYQTRITNAKTSWRSESVWEYEVMFEGRLGRHDELKERRTAQTATAAAVALAAVMEAVLTPLLFSRQSNVERFHIQCFTLRVALWLSQRP